jgi:mannose-1-phosphate guanylyltransferase
MTGEAQAPLVAVIMAGGRGSRFWPRSRKRLPKQCVALGGGRTLIQATVDRLEGLVPPERILVVTGQDMAQAVVEQLPEVPRENVLVEPRGRNTAPCIAWAAVEIARRFGGETVMVVLPADHVIRDAPAFRAALAAGAQAARRTNGLFTLGIRPTRPETGFGYIHGGEALGDWEGRSFHHVRAFVEKPDVETAAAYVASGSYYWNAGMFVWTVDAIRDAFRAHMPATWGAMAKLEFDPGAFDSLWGAFEATSIDYGILEHAQNVYVLPTDFGWSDVGAWTALPEISEAVAGGWIEAADSVVIDAHENIVHAPNKLVALVGVEGLIVVDTEDALLITRREDAQRVREVIAKLESTGRTKYL